MTCLTFKSPNNAGNQLKLSRVEARNMLMQQYVVPLLKTRHAALPGFNHYCIMINILCFVLQIFMSKVLIQSLFINYF